MTRAKIRTFSQTAKFWNSENKEILAFHLLSREKNDRRANLHFKMITRTDPLISNEMNFNCRGAA